jgi:hypothetical protein
MVSISLWNLCKSRHACFGKSFFRERIHRLPSNNVVLFLIKKYIFTHCPSKSAIMARKPLLYRLWFDAKTARVIHMMLLLPWLATLSLWCLVSWPRLPISVFSGLFCLLHNNPSIDFKRYALSQSDEAQSKDNFAKKEWSPMFGLLSTLIFWSAGYDLVRKYVCAERAEY